MSEQKTIVMDRERDLKRARRMGIAAAMKCKNETCNNPRAYGSSRCGECSAKHGAIKTE